MQRGAGEAPMEVDEAATAAAQSFEELWRARVAAGEDGNEAAAALILQFQRQQRAGAEGRAAAPAVGAAKPANEAAASGTSAPAPMEPAASANPVATPATPPATPQQSTEGLNSAESAAVTSNNAAEVVDLTEGPLAAGLAEPGRAAPSAIDVSNQSDAGSASSVSPAQPPAAHAQETFRFEPEVTLGQIEELIAEAENTGSFTPLIRKIGSAFSNPEAIVASFCTPNGEPDLDQARAIFERLGEVEEPPGVQNALLNALQSLASQLSFAMTQPALKHIPALVALEYVPFQYDPDLVNSVSLLLASIANLPRESHDRVVRFWRGCSSDYLETMLSTVQMFITLKTTLGKAVAKFNYLREGIVTLSLLHEVNESRRFVAHDEFYNNAINELATEFDDFLKEDLVSRLEEDHEARHSRRDRQRVSFCDYPFVLDPGSKARVLQLENSLQQNRIARQNGLLRRPYFHVVVRRDDIVNDVLDIIAQSPQEALKLPLRVQFEGEQGIDEGGVQKEFFLLMVRKLLDPEFGMFVQDEDSKQLWFNPNTFEFKLKFELIGIILGLAIYNGVILDLNLPIALYKKLLGVSVKLEDFKAYSPRAGKSLEELLHFEGDVENTFCQTFQVSLEVFGEVKTVDLKEGGASIPVTEHNREEYVKLYVDYFLNKSVDALFQPFNKGFHLVCGGTMLNMFRPEEMELLLCGSPQLDFDALERSCQYEDGFTANSPTVKFLWSVLRELSEEKKKKFLMFTTGTDRVPIRGLSALRLVISRNGEDSDRLPTAHTCFNHLLVPEYTTREKLKDRLLLAIEHSEGFGTM